MNKHYSNELKELVVKEYLESAEMNELVLRYEPTDKSRIRKWRNQFLRCGCFPDGRGTGKGGWRPRNVNTSSMTKEEYIRYMANRYHLFTVQRWKTLSLAHQGFRRQI